MDHNLSQQFANLFHTHQANELYANMQADFVCIRVNDFDVPCTAVHQVQANCYTASPHAMIVDYGADELIKLPSYQRLIAGSLLKLLSGILRVNQIEKFAALNNYGLSTNSFSSQFQRINFTELTQQGCLKFPQHCLAIRSLNKAQNQQMMQQLAQTGWQFIATRQVYLIQDWAAAYQKINTKRDAKLLTDEQYVFERLTPNSPEHDFQAALTRYNQLYLEKYSRQNVHFTARFLRQAVTHRILQLYVLRNQKTQQIIGATGIVIDGNDATVPIVGYDTNLSPKLGLYRRCMAQAMSVCRAQNLYLNFSSGAPDFKKLRGATPEIEYMAVYTAHLPKWRRIIWQILAWLSTHYYAKLLQKYGL